MRHVVAGGDALVLAPTGGGKSICFQVPALCRRGTAVVISPLIALMDDQVAALRQLGVAAGALHSDLDPAEARSVTRDLIEQQLDLLYVSPERLLAQRHAGAAVAPAARAVRDRRGALRLAMGPRVPPGIPRAGVSGGSLPRRAARRADRDRRSAHARRHPARAAHGCGRGVRRELPSAEPAHRRRAEGGRDRAAARSAGAPSRRLRHRLLRQPRQDRARGGSGWRRRASRRSPSTPAWKPSTKREALARFRSGEAVVVVATIAFGMGIDRPDVRFVVHLDMPDSPEA